MKSVAGGTKSRWGIEMYVNVNMVKRASLLLLLVGLAIFLGASCGQGQTNLVVPLLSLPGSNQSGTAELVAQGDKTQVVINVAPATPDGTSQPAHIHFGTCGARLGQVHYPLASLVDGKSETVVNARLEDLRDGNNAINIHKSLPEIQIYTACGNIPQK